MEIKERERHSKGEGKAMIKTRKAMGKARKMYTMKRKRTRKLRISQRN